MRSAQRSRTGFSASDAGLLRYVQNFGGTLAWRARIPYLQELGVRYLHLLPSCVRAQAKMTAALPSPVSMMWKRRWAPTPIWKR
jgi:pullulanase/glycogen debranching enzyme